MSYKDGVRKWSVLPKNSKNEPHRPSQLEFVTVTQPANFKTKENRTTIQRHTIRQGKLRERREKAQWHAQLQKQRVEDGVLHTLQLPQEPCPITYSPYMSELIVYFRTVLFADRYPQCVMRAMYLETGAQSPCVFHALLYAAAAHHDGRQGVEPRRMTLYHGAISLALLRDKVQNAQRSDYIEILLSSLLHRNLANMEGREDVRKVHERAVEYMLSSWSDWESEAPKLAIRRTIKTGELQRAIAHATETVTLEGTPTASPENTPLFPFVEFSNFPFSGDVNTALDFITTSDPEPIETGRMRRLIECIESLKLVHEEIRNPDDDRCLTRLQNDVAEQTNAIQALLVDPTFMEASPLTASYLFTSILFGRSLLSSLPLSSEVHKNLVQALESCAIQVFDRGDWKQNPLQYLWVCMTVIAARRPRSHVSAFNPIFTVVMLTLGTEHRWHHQFDRLVGTFIWVQILLERQSSSIWNPSD